MGQYMSSASNPKQEDVWTKHPKREDVLILVLARLPVKTLLHCTCVCKTWHRIIYSRSFATTHLTNQKQPSNTNKFILFQDSCLCTLLTDQNPLFDSTKQSKLYYTPQSFGRDHGIGRCRLKIYGVCDGLFCLSNYGYKVGDDIHLWNPICRKAKKLPELVYSTKVAYGSVSFGYHDDDYKVVVISPSDVIYTVCVYSLSSDSWNIIHHVMYCKTNTQGFLPSEPTKFVDGTAYMMTESTYVLKESRRIVSYNLKDDIIREFSGPECYNDSMLLHRPGFSFRLEAHGDTIAVLGVTEGSKFGEEVSRSLNVPQIAMWKLRDKSSSTPTWEIKFVVEMQVGGQNYPLGFMYSGQYLVRSLFTSSQKRLTKFLLCDLESSHVTEVRSGDDFFYEDLACSVDFSSAESLLLLKEDKLDPFVQKGSSCSSMLFTLHDASDLMHLQGKNKKRKLQYISRIEGPPHSAQNWPIVKNENKCLF